MASLHILKYTLPPISISQPYFLGKSDSRKTIFRLRSFNTVVSPRKYIQRPKFRVYCSVKEGDNQSNSEEPPESLFMKELKRRGMTPTSLLEETNRGSYGVEDEMKYGDEEEEDRGGFFKRKAVSTEFDKEMPNQREISMQLNSEGLEVNIFNSSESIA